VGSTLPEDELRSAVRGVSDKCQMLARATSPN
jgi:hypothetical protein